MAQTIYKIINQFDTIPTPAALPGLAHSFNRVAEAVRISFPEVDNLISNVKKVFLKAPNRVQKFVEMYPNLILPPKPVLTRWGTWLEAAKYYSENLENIKLVINCFNSDDAHSIATAKEIICSEKVKQQLVYIFTNFYCIKSAITALESNKLTLIEALNEIEKVHQNLNNAHGSIGDTVKNKFLDVLHKNPGFKPISTIANILEDKMYH